MFDLPNDLKIIQGLKPGSTGNTASTGDFVNCENLHYLYAICDISRNVASTATFNWYTASAYAGTGSSALSTGCKWYVNDGCGFDRLVQKTTSNSSYTSASSTGRLQVVSRLDCAAMPSSHSYAAFANHDQSQATNFVHITYVGVPRYKGVGSFLATTSST